MAGRRGRAGRGGGRGAGELLHPATVDNSADDIPTRSAVDREVEASRGDDDRGHNPWRLMRTSHTRFTKHHLVPPTLDVMRPRLSPRLAAIVDALSLTPASRVLEIGCGSGAAARAIARQLDSGHILAIDRSSKAVAQARAGSALEIASGRMSVRHVAAELFVMEPDDVPFDIVFAVRVGALDGRHPDAGQQAITRIRSALAPGGRVFIDAGQPLRELEIAVSPEPHNGHPRTG